MSIDRDDNERRYRELVAAVKLATAIIAVARLSFDRQSIREHAHQVGRVCEGALALIPHTILSPDQERDVWDGLIPVMGWLERWA